MRRIPIVLVLLGVAPGAAAGFQLCAAQASGLVQASSVEQAVLHLDTVLDLARQRAPAIAAARARVSQAEERRRATTLLPDPLFSAGFGRGESRVGGASRSESTFDVSQFLPAPWGLRSRKTAGNAAVAAANFQLDEVVLDVLFEARTLYYAAALGTARAVALSQAAEDARSLNELVARRVEVGEAPGADQLRTKVEALRAASEARAAIAEVEGARAALNRFLLDALGFGFTLPTDLDPSDLTPLPDENVELAVSRNPAIRTAQSKVEAAKSTVAAEKAARLPGLEFSTFALNELDRKATGAAVRIAIPLWNRNRAGVGLARAELVEAESEAIAIRARIAADVERLMRLDRASRDNAAAYRNEILPAARETLGIVRNSLEQGEANLLAWLEARRSYLEILRASYEAQFNAFLTRAELVRLTGEPDAIDNQ